MMYSRILKGCAGNFARIFVACLFLTLGASVVFADTASSTTFVVSYDAVRAVYLTSGYVESDKKVNELISMIKTTGANAVVIDFKDNNVPKKERMKKLVGLFQNEGAYTIARIVAFQDSYLARNYPESAIKNGAGELWYSGKKEWQRYWLDPASLFAQFYVIEIAKRAADAGFDEVQLDYVRFPTDGDMSDIVYPFFNATTTTKTQMMNSFFARFKKSLSAYNPNVRLGIDIFGNVMTYGQATGIGQDLASLAYYFDVISPMSYPSHYGCGAFGVQDPTAYPYLVYASTLQKGLDTLKDKKIVIRPWVQDFTMTSIYRCGSLVQYTKARVMEEIKGGKDLGVNGFMLWNANSRFTAGVFGEKATSSTSVP